VSDEPNNRNASIRMTGILHFDPVSRADIDRTIGLAATQRARSSHDGDFCDRVWVGRTYMRLLKKSPQFYCIH
jgi:hypothetical protein